MVVDAKFRKRSLAELRSKDIAKIISDIFELNLTYKEAAVQNQVSIQLVHSLIKKHKENPKFLMNM